MTYSKDWTGNKTTAFSALGASNHSQRERAERDLYCTDQIALVSFLKALKRDSFVIKGPVWECASGLHHIVEVLERLNYTVISSDIEDRSEWPEFKKTTTKLQKLDFLNDVSGVDMIHWGIQTLLTNPPYSEAEDFVRKAGELLRDGQHLIMLLRLQWLESQRRLKLYREFPYRYVYVYSARVGCARGGVEEPKESSAICFCWFIWEKGYVGETVVRFIE